MQRSIHGRAVRVVTGLAVAAALTLGAVQGASAAEGPDDTTAVIDQALQEVGQAEATSEPDSKAVDIVGDTAVVDLGAAELSLTPEDADDSQLRVRKDGVQAISVLDPGESEASFALELPSGATLAPTANGGFDVSLRAADAVVSLAHIEAPWAVDADGEHLPTSYTLDEGVITQQVDTEGAAYPIVADPKITVGLWNAPYGPGVYLNLTGAEIKTYGAAIIAVGGVGALVTCTVAKIPPAIRTFAAFLCGAVGLPTARTLFDYIARVVRTAPFANTTCYQTLVGSNRPFIATARSNCS